MALAALAAALVIVIGAGFGWQHFRTTPVTTVTQVTSVTPAVAPAAGTAVPPSAVQPQTNAGFVGSETCGSCHATEFKAWRGSQHADAMAHATDGTVRGDFNDVSIDHRGVTTRFMRKDGRFMVETDGPDGKPATFEVKYTFGIDPMQQYLVAFPDGRIQALPFAWDTRPKQSGGQRWFHLYPDETITASDELHWTKLNQNWNFMCAECHSTGVRKNYDAVGDRFATHFAEISVGCEACHGEGARHVAWAKGNKAADPGPSKGLVVGFDERKGVTWPPHASTGQPSRSTPPALLRKEVETCGLCHARRSQQSEDWVPGRWLSETHHVTPMNRRQFHADGQMRDDEETYNYAPFKQSRMFAAGVTCSDCHDPHSGQLRAQGNAVCTQCHAADRYDVAGHTHHDGIAAATQCVACHMPERRYMVIDRRHDHGFRVPRPDLSVSLGTPNACTDCHRDRSAQWAAAAVEGWYGPQRKDFQTWAPAFHAAWRGLPPSASKLDAIASDPAVPGYVRGSALTELDGSAASAAQRALADPDPEVRIGALDLLENLRPEQVWPLAAPLLADPVRGVRSQAAAVIGSVPASASADQRAAFVRASDEWVASQKLNADRPEGRTTLANHLLRGGRAAEAETEYRAALRLDPGFTPAAVNLADLYRSSGRDSEGESVLQAAVAATPRDASAHHALGLTLVRRKQLEAALAELRKAAELDPAQPRYAYVYAVGLNSAGRSADAIAVLRESLQRHPGDVDSLEALIALAQASGDRALALSAAERLAALRPQDARLRGLIDALKITAPREQR